MWGLWVLGVSGLVVILLVGGEIRLGVVDLLCLLLAGFAITYISGCCWIWVSWVC